MTVVREMILKITSDNDQDQAECDEWMRESDDAERLAIWQAIQRPYADPVMEILSRFAQLAFAQSVERVFGGKDGGK